MWDKPKEITSCWPSAIKWGVEISMGGQHGWTGSPQEIIDRWKRSAGLTQVILEQGPWKKWKSVGCAFEPGFVHCWFARQTDPMGEFDPGKKYPHCGTPSMKPAFSN